MLLLRCSLLADSISRSISFWPSTIATRSSSAWVALNSMRFIVVSPALESAAARRTVKRRRPTGAGLEGGGRWREEPRGQQKLPGYEGSDAGIGHRGQRLVCHRIITGWRERKNEGCLSRERGWFSSRCRSNGLAAAS